MARMYDLHHKPINIKNPKTPIYIGPIPPIGEQKVHSASSVPTGREERLVLIESALLEGERIVLALEVNEELVNISEARYPGLVLYFPPEIDALDAAADDDDGNRDKFIFDTHKIKQAMGGWIVPSRKKDKRIEVQKPESSEEEK